MRAEAAPHYADRDRLYRQLTQERNETNPRYAEGWYMRGLNDFTEGQRLSLANPDEAKKTFHLAAETLNQAAPYLLIADPAKASMAAKIEVLALFHQETESSRREAWSRLDKLIKGPTTEHQAELYYLAGLVASHLVKDHHQTEFIPLAEQTLKEGISHYPKSPFVPDMLNLIGLLYQDDGRYSEAEKTFLELAAQYPESTLAGEAWFWAASCAEHLKKEDATIKLYRKNAFEKYPHCRYAAEAYLAYYPYRDYLQGSRTPLKHLEAMPRLFPQSPLVISAYYLTGLDQKKERISQEGKAIRQKNLLAAIAAFHEAESTFDTLHQQSLIPADQLIYFATLRYRSTLERALANLAIAEESKGAKRQIYLEYAEEVFNQVVNDFTSPDNTLAQALLQGEPYHRLWEESEFWLAHTYVQRHNDGAADKLLTQMIDHYHQADITKGYFLARTWYEKGMIAMRRNDYRVALKDFSLAEDASKGKVFSTDQRLDLWIQQSLCYKELKQYDLAMLLLSQVINDDAVSGLRIKAMLLRADIYALEGRPELAQKQLEATARKGGEWGQKAKEKLKER